MSEWSFVKLGDISKVQTGPFGSQLHQKDYVENGIPLVTVKNLGQRRINRNNLDGVSEQDAKRLRKYTLKTGDIVFSRVGAYIDKSSLVTSEEDGWIFSSSTLMSRPNAEIVDSGFLIYVLNSPKFKAHIRNVAVGATRPSLNTTILSESEVHLPPLPEQKAIAHILGTLDDKIELNRKMNQTLEAMAQALFKSWFVDFDPVMDNALAAGNDIPEELQAMAEKRALVPHSKKLISKSSELSKEFPSSFVYEKTLGKWIPEGWEVKSFGEEFNITMGQSPPGPSYNEDGIGKPFFQGKTDFGFRFPTNRIYCTDPKREAKKNDTLISVRAPVGNANLANSECVIGRGLSAVRHKSNSVSYTYYSVLALREVFDVFEGEGTVFGSINQASLKSIQVVKPSIKTMDAFDQFVSKWDNKIELNSDQTETLTQLRNRLLPELISGRVRIQNIN